MDLMCMCLRLIGWYACARQTRKGRRALRRLIGIAAWRIQSIRIVCQVLTMEGVIAGSLDANQGHPYGWK